MPAPHLTRNPGYRAPQVARVSARLLRELLDALDGALEPRDVGRLLGDLNFLITRAEEGAWPLPGGSR
jgi:hypothetical protein